MKEMDAQNAQLHRDLQGNDSVARDDIKKLSELASALYKAIIHDTGSSSKPKTLPSSVRDLMELCQLGIPAALDLHNDREQLRRQIKDFELRQQYMDLKGTDKDRLEGEIQKLRKDLNDKLKENENMKHKLANSGVSCNAALDEAQKTIKDLQVQNEKLRGDLVGTAVPSSCF
jgi:predicted RNase H-like nuclease (RuvC/YqgF family)